MSDNATVKLLVHCAAQRPRKVKATLKVRNMLCMSIMVKQLPLKQQAPGHLLHNCLPDIMQQHLM
jgi:hypothetical protein